VDNETEDDEWDVLVQLPLLAIRSMYNCRFLSIQRNNRRKNPRINSNRNSINSVWKFKEDDSLSFSSSSRPCDVMFNNLTSPSVAQAVIATADTAIYQWSRSTHTKIPR
jgi:hypothetical protein